jgi:PRTRC genetic system protein C
MAKTDTTPRARRFMYNGMELPDPDAEKGTTEVRDFWANTYPELASARVKGPTPDGDVDVFTFERNVGVKG